KSFRVGHCARDFLPVANKSRIPKQTFNPRRCEPSDRCRVEPRKTLAISGSLCKNGLPAQPGLCSFENEEFKQNLVVVERNAPLDVVARTAPGCWSPAAANAAISWCVGRHFVAGAFVEESGFSCSNTKAGILHRRGLTSSGSGTPWRALGEQT